MDGSGVVTTGGGIYDGPVVDGVPEGYGILKWPQRPRSAAVYKGAMKHGVREGRGEFETTKGNKFSGVFEKNMRHGEGVQSYNNSCSVVEGTFVKGQIEGVGKWKFDKYLEYEGEFRGGVIHGEGKMVFVDGTVYVGDFYEGKRQGKGKSVWSDGDTYEGDYHKDKREGTGCYTWASGQQYTGEFVNGRRDGLGVVTWPNKSKFVGFFREGKREGYGLLFHHDHSLDSGIWDGPMLTRLVPCKVACEKVRHPELYEECKELYPGKMTKIAIHIMKCAFNGDTLHVVRLVERNGIHPDMCTSGGVSLLMLAASQGHIDTVSGLLDVGASVDWQTDARMTTLNLSYQLVNRLDIDKLPLHEISAQILSDSDKLHTTYEEEFEDSDGDIKFCEDQQKMLDTYHLLLARGANANISIYPKPIIISAVQLNDFKVVKLLLLHGASPDKVDENDPRKRSPLMFAAGALIDAEGDDNEIELIIPIFKLLVEGHCNVDMADSNGWTALHSLALVHTPAAIDLIPLLVSKGANVNAHTVDGHTPLSLAIKSGNISSARMLLKHGVDPNVMIGKERNTTCLNLVFTSHPMRVDADIRHTLVELLLGFNADPTIPIQIGGSGKLGTAMDCFHYVLQHEQEFKHASKRGRNSGRRRRSSQRSLSPILSPRSISPLQRRQQQHHHSPHRLQSHELNKRNSVDNKVARNSISTSNTGKKPRRQTYAYLPGQGNDEQPPSEEDLSIAEMLTQDMRKHVLKQKSVDLPACFQCGRSFNQHLTTFSGSKLIYFCGGRCKMRALNGPNRKQILHSLRLTNPAQWRLLQQQDDSQVIWRGENVDMFGPPPRRSITAPPDFVFEGIAQKQKKVSRSVAPSEVEEDSSRINVTPLPSLTDKEVKKSTKTGESLKGRLGFFPRLHDSSPHSARKDVKQSMSASSLSVVNECFGVGRASRLVQKTTFHPRPSTTSGSNPRRRDFSSLYTSIIDTTNEHDDLLESDVNNNNNHNNNTSQTSAPKNIKKKIPKPSKTHVRGKQAKHGVVEPSDSVVFSLH
eukprot:m.65103 g.65103  ORF g.65103 m.65103 type:complete len:1035 (-) comp11514_c0_seq1:1728-4832(-)